MKYILGVDGGGTGTQARICNEHGDILSEEVAGPGNYKNVGIKEAELNITNAVLGAINKINSSNINFFESSCFGLSGIDCDRDKQIYEKIILSSKLKRFLNIHSNIICNDSLIGLVAGTDSKNAIIIICGTGSTCFGVNENGVQARVNGWDFILGDQGSGYAIGIKALRAVLKAYDGRSVDTLLSQSILEYLGLNDISDLINWTYLRPFSTDRFADLARVVCKTAEMKDRVSIEILKEEAEEALASILAVAKEINLLNKKFDLVFVGNVFKCEKYFKQALIKKLKEKFKWICLSPLTEKPVSGAIKLALSLIKNHQK